MNFQTYGPKALAYLENWLGSLPEGRAIVTIVQRPNRSGYSRPGYVVVADTGDAQLDGAWAKAGYIAHELSHAWWSNADFTGEDYWLVESTADYVALRFVQQQFGADVAAPLIAQKAMRAARSGPILGHGRANGDAVYGRGPVLLFSLEKTVGRAALDEVLRALAQRDHITTRDFLDALTKVSGDAAAKAFEARLRESDFSAA